VTLPDGLPPPKRGKAVLVILLGITLGVMDGSIVNLALPGIAQELNAPASQAIWVVNAYQIASLVMLLPLAALGDSMVVATATMAGPRLRPPFFRWLHGPGCSR
jgi:DHA2 family multidrug resistance protein-like MFS transporter